MPYIIEPSYKLWFKNAVLAYIFNNLVARNLKLCFLNYFLIGILQNENQDNKTRIK